MGALVTRNSRKTTGVFCEKLQALQEGEQTKGQRSLDLSFKRIITRDDTVGDKTIPPKPDPTAMNIIANECFGVPSDNGVHRPEILMVGDSITNDVGFGKNAGVQTALLATEDDSGGADIRIERLSELPKTIWKTFAIDGPLGNTKEANQRPLHGSPPPKPESELCRLVVRGDVAAIRVVLEDLGIDEITRCDEESGNTALIWAAETGNAEITSLLLKTVAAKSSDDNEDQTERLLSFANHRGFLGATALNRAARRGHTHILKLLLSPEDETKDTDTIIQGEIFNMDLPNHKLQYPLHFAAFKKNPEALEYLLRCGANPWVLDRKGRTPLEDTSCERCKSLLQEAMLRSSNLQRQ